MLIDKMSLNRNNNTIVVLIFFNQSSNYRLIVLKYKFSCIEIHERTHILKLDVTIDYRFTFYKT